jgi:copper chaperone
VPGFFNFEARRAPYAVAMSVSASYSVSGMTCDHCVRAVTAEMEKLSGVTDVDVDLGSGRVTVTSADPLDEAEVRAALDEAGYELVGSTSA